MKKTCILALVAATMAFSCNKNVVEQAPEQKQEPVLRTFTCTIAEPDTKLAIDDANGKTTWEMGDEILFHGKYAGGAYSTVVTLADSDISADGKSFTVTVPDFTNGADQAKWASSSANYSASNIIALYPASAATMVDSGSTNWYNKNFFGETNHPLMSAFNDGYDSNSFTFYNLCGILSFIVTGDYDSYVLSGNNDETVSYTKYTSRLYKKTDDTINTDWVYTEAGKDYSTAVKTISGTVNNGTETRIFIPGGVTFSGGFTIHFIKSGDIVKELSTTKAVSIPRNSYRPMGNVTTYLKDYVAPTKHDNTIEVNVATATDLGSSATANCYIVSSAGDYKFKAVKGNSSTVVGTVASVAILWETWNNAETVTAKSVIAAADYDLQSGGDPYVVFKTPATLHAGNAVLAAKDAGGNILWSWHIWVPATAITSVTDGSVFSATNVMDRNLGALVEAVASADTDVDIKSLGLMYQWGRKDPFVNKSVLAGSTKAEIAGAAESVAAGTISLEESIANPRTLGHTDNGDWNSTQDNSLWSSSKTIYDPCPVGYKVPARNTSMHVWSSSNKVTDATGWAYNTEHYWFTLGSLVFPDASYRDDYSVGSIRYSAEKPRTMVWSSYASGTVKAYCIDLRFNESSFSRKENPKARVAAVRCVKEE